MQWVEATRAMHRERMQAEGLPDVAIRSFLRALAYVAEGGETSIAETSIEPVTSLPNLSSLPSFEAAGAEALGATVVIKLNGGLGTSMGLTRAKSLLPVRPGRSFLDLIAEQVLWQRKSWDIDLPLVLMNSFRTQADSLRTLASHAIELDTLPLDFVQSKVPRIDPGSGRPIEWPADPSLEWCPPGHGDLYIMLESSGMLDQLRARGIRYAFVSNSDNLGAVLDRRILGWFASGGMPFAMEVAERTVADKKGGHLAQRGDQLILRESAQCPEADRAAFEDVERHAFFNTNNLWINLDALAERLAVSPEGLPLPVMRNEKTVVSGDATTPRCLQLETAMGAAIECFPGAQAICVPRERFAPVKSTSDLLVLWSDAYEKAEDGRMMPVDASAHRTRRVDLDPQYYGLIADLEARFPSGAPSLIECTTLKIRGDYRFEAGVRIVGDVMLENESEKPITIPAGAVLDGHA